MAGMPPLYTCMSCGLELRPQDGTSVRKATVWLKSKGSTVHKVIEEEHVYKHNFCSDEPLDQGIQYALF